MIEARRVTSVDTMVYNYLVRQGSITKSMDSKKRQKLLDDSLFLVENKMKQMQTVADKRWFQGMIAHSVVSIIGTVSRDYYPERRKYLNVLNRMGVYPLSTYHLTKLAIRKVKLINLSPSLACWLLHLMRRKVH